MIDYVEVVLLNILDNILTILGLFLYVILIILSYINNLYNKLIKY